MSMKLDMLLEKQPTSMSYRTHGYLQYLRIVAAAYFFQSPNFFTLSILNLNLV